MEKYFQDVAKKIINDKNSDYFAAHSLNIYAKTKSTKMLHNYVFWYIFYCKPYGFNENQGCIVLYTMYEKKNRNNWKIVTYVQPNN